MVTFLVVLGFGLVPPALPRYALHYGLTNAEVGLLLTAFSTGMLVFSLPGGMTADRLGLRRVALAGCLVSMVGAAVASALPTFWLLVSAQFAQGVGAALFTTAGVAAIIAQTADDRVGRAMATHQGVLLLGMSVAPALGGMAVQGLGLRGPFIVYAGAATIGLLVSAIVINDAESKESDSQDSSTPSIGKRSLLIRMFSTRAAIIALIVSFFTHWAVGGVRNTLVPLFGESTFGMGPVSIGWLLTATAIANVIVIRHAGQMIDRGRRLVTIVSMGVLGVAALLAGFSSAVWALFAATLLFGAAKGYAAVVPLATLTDLADRRIYGTVVGIQRTATSLGLVIGPISVGLLADAFAFRTVFVIAGALVLAAALLSMAMPETHPVRSRSSADTRGVLTRTRSLEEDQAPT